MKGTRNKLCRRAWGWGFGQFLGVYPLLRVWLITVPPLRRVTFGKRPKSNQKVFALTFGPLAKARGSFAPGSILAQRLRFAPLLLHSLCTTASYGRCAPTPGSIPPLSLPMGPARQDQKAVLELALIV